MQEIGVIGQVAGHLFIFGYCLGAIMAVVVIEQDEPVAGLELVGDVDILEGGEVWLATSVGVITPLS